MEEKHYFTSFDEGEDSLFERELFSNNSISTENDNEINLENYYSLIDDLATENIFLKGVYKFLNKLEGEWDQDNEQSIINFIKKKYRTKGIPWEKTQIQWLKGIKEPSTKQSNKENSYNFCYALDMDLKTTAEFMFKYFQVIPFNVKNRVDAIYFYCIKNKKIF